MTDRRVARALSLAGAVAFVGMTLGCGPGNRAPAAEPAPTEAAFAVAPTDEPSQTPTPASTVAPTPTPEPVVQTRTVVTKVKIPFTTRRVNDSSLSKGSTKPASSCDPNYSGCVPIASDVDCAGGSGNGPAYLSGVVRVIGSDIYDLDRDNDGLACDP